MSDGQWLGAEADEAAHLEGRFQADQERAHEEEAREEPDMLPVPVTGELVRRDDPLECARALEALRRVEAQIRDAKRALSEAIAEQARLRGTKTLRVEGRTVTVGGGERRIIDGEALAANLRAAGMPDGSVREIVDEQVTVVWKVDARRAEQAARARPEYRAALDRATDVQEAPWTVSVK